MPGIDKNKKKKVNPRITTKNKQAGIDGPSKTVKKVDNSDFSPSKNTVKKDMLAIKARPKSMKNTFTDDTTAKKKLKNTFTDDTTAKKAKEKDSSDFANSKKTKVQPPKLRPKNLKKKEKNSDNKKTKVVTAKMLENSPFTSLRDYLNDRDGKKRRDGKKVVLKSEETKTAKTKKKRVRGPKVSVRQGTPDQKRGSKVQKASEKKSSFFDSIGSGIKKAVKETKRNFEGDFKKKTGRYKLISTGKTNFNKKKK